MVVLLEVLGGSWRGKRGERIQEEGRLEASVASNGEEVLYFKCYMAEIAL